MAEQSIPKDLQDCLQILSSVLGEQIRTVEALIGVLVGEETAKSMRQEPTVPPDSCAVVLMGMLQALGSSDHSLLRLSDQVGLQVRDCYSIARSIVELATNACYVMAAGPEVAERAMRHARQKAFRDLKRESKVADNTIQLTWKAVPEADQIRGLTDDLAEFSSATGRERNWLDMTVDARIAAVGPLSDSAMISLHFAAFMMYRHSSEILHGTYFGVVYFLGLTAPGGGPRTAASFLEGLAGHQLKILMAANLATNAVIKAFHAAYGFEAAFRRSQEHMSRVRAIPYFQGNETPSSLNPVVGSTRADRQSAQRGAPNSSGAAAVDTSSEHE